MPWPLPAEHVEHGQTLLSRIFGKVWHMPSRAAWHGLACNSKRFFLTPARQGFAEDRSHEKLGVR